MAMNREDIQTLVADPNVAEAEKTDRLVAALTDQRSIARLWTLLIVALGLALLASTVGVLIAVLDANAETSPDVLITMFTTTSAGLLGLFVKSPTSST